VGKYLVEHFLEMAYQEKPNDKIEKIFRLN